MIHFPSPLLFLSTLITTSLITFIATIPSTFVQADITCSQSPGTPDTFRIGSTLKFQWTDTMAADEGDTAFRLELYCAQNGKWVKTLVEGLSTGGSISPVSWVVNSTVMGVASAGVDGPVVGVQGECPLNQYQGAFTWTTHSTVSDEQMTTTTTGTSKCKIMLLLPSLLPSNTPPSLDASRPSPGTNNNNDINARIAATSAQDDPEDLDPSDIIVTEKTKHIVMGVGSAVGLLVLAGFVAFYVIRHKNKRAEQKAVSRKLREPISDHSGAFVKTPSGQRSYNQLESGTTSTAPSLSSGSSVASTRQQHHHHHQQQQQQQPMTEVTFVTSSSLPSSASSNSTNTRPTTPIAAAHAKVSSTGTTSVLTSSFTPPSSQLHQLHQQLPSSSSTSTAYHQPQQNNTHPW